MTAGWQEQITGHFSDGLGSVVLGAPVPPAADSSIGSERPPVGRATDSLPSKAEQPQRNKQRLNAETSDPCYHHQPPSWLLSQ